MVKPSEEQLEDQREKKSEEVMEVVERAISTRKEVCLRIHRWRTSIEALQWWLSSADKSYHDRVSAVLP
jgi:hypothetical protein